MQILLDSTLSPQNSTLTYYSGQMETLVENAIDIELFDCLKDSYCLQPTEELEVIDLLKSGMIKLVFTKDAEPLHKKYNLKEYFGKKIEPIQPEPVKQEIVKPKSKPIAVKKGKKGKRGKVSKGVSKATDKKKPAKQPEDIPVEEEETKEEATELIDESILFSPDWVNQISFKLDFFLDPEEPSRVRLLVYPQSGDGQSYFVKVLVDNQEVQRSNYEVTIVRSDLQDELEKQEEEDKERQRRILEEQRKAAEEA